MNKLWCVLVVAICVICFCGCTEVYKNNQMVVEIYINANTELNKNDKVALNEVVNTIKSFTISNYEQLAENGLNTIANEIKKQHGSKVVSIIKLQKEKNIIEINFGDNPSFFECNKVYLPIN